MKQKLKTKSTSAKKSTYSKIEATVFLHLLRTDLVTFAKLQRELFRKIRQKRESLAKVTRSVRSRCVGTL